MLEQIDLSKKMNEKEYNETVSHLEIRLAAAAAKVQGTKYSGDDLYGRVRGGRKRNDDQPADPVSGSQRLSGICHGK